MQASSSTLIGHQAEVKQAFSTPDWYFRKLGFRVRLRKEIVGEFAQGSSYQSILDIGCGDGSISLPLLEPGRQLTLLDISEEMLALARSRVPARWRAQVQTMNGDFLEAKLEARRYDLIVCLGVLAYIEAPEPFMEKVTSLLAPAGRLIVECTDGPHFLTRLIRLYCRLTGLLTRPVVPLAVHAARQVIAGFERRGLELQGAYRHASPLPVVRLLMSQEILRRTVVALHGRPGNNRLAWLGNECTFLFRRKNA